MKSQAQQRNRESIVRAARAYVAAVQAFAHAYANDDLPVTTWTEGEATVDEAYEVLAAVVAAADLIDACTGLPQEE